MSNTLVAESKLQFYPTSELETYRILPFVGTLSDNGYARYEFDRIASKKDKDIIIDQVLNSYNSFTNAYYSYFLDKQKYDLIKDLFKYEIKPKNEGKIVIADLFAGEGKWLETFKSFISLKTNNIITVANEIEKNRFNKIKKSKYIDECYNSAFEDLELPKKSISIMLFNPPYGESNGERNVRRYLKMILERELIVEGGYLIGVIRDDDVLDCIDLFAQYFWTFHLYKVHPEEYKKWRQYVYIGVLRHTPYNLNNPIDINDFNQEMNKIKKLFNKQLEFSFTMYPSYGVAVPAVEWDILKNNVKIIKNKDKYISKPDKVLKWIKNITELKDLSCEQIVLPKEPKVGEIANIISSGMINGELSLGNQAKHIVVGGVKNLEKQETNIKKNDKGEKIIETKTIRYTEPYLNLLINKNGKLEIKELGGNS